MFFVYVILILDCFIKGVLETDFLQKLDQIKYERGLKSNSELARACGVPYTTIDGFYKKGYENAKISTLKKIAEAFNVSLDWLILDRSPDEYTAAEKSLVRSWRRADDDHRNIAATALGFVYIQQKEKEA